ncbi:MarR family winged helix-turn-helix transcriptional regulator [Leptospira ilyithenensis]|uniref:MarR family transcriptional regulator n=1 Tax=Leptospira ilyithenensis TaxID=2484901 RepID=A0A4R9LLF2_9LEPT|nr:MarR family winged helix-turn-helix transcriptional regulator [Leptospira ilyithenensis]TGN07085.1 MarR family transcriptional regulator [Leptospira ilyithenensis]
MSKISSSGKVFSEIILEVFRINRLLLDFGDRITEPVGLSSTKWQVLGVVEHGPAPVPQIARIMGLTRQAVQQTANSLEEEGMIRFTDNPHHIRAKLLNITPKGRKALDYVQSEQKDWANRISEKHGLDQLKTLQKELLAIKESLEEDILDVSESEL